MTQELYASAYDQWGAATDPTIRSRPRLNMAYFAVAGASQVRPLFPDVVEVGGCRH